MGRAGKRVPGGGGALRAQTSVRQSRLPPHPDDDGEPLTQDVWEEGMPPEPHSRSTSHFPSV